MTTVDNSVLLSTECEYRLNTDTLFEVVTHSLSMKFWGFVYREMESVGQGQSFQRRRRC
jgi:hypothetical protein